MQVVFRANLSAANWPFVSNFHGRSVVIPQYDENYQPVQSFSGEDADRDKGIPQVFYLHNCMPTGQGFKSIAFNRIVKPVSVPLPVNSFDKIIPAKDPSENKAFIGITTDARVYIFTAASSGWVEITSAVPGWPGGTVYYAYANGFTYLCFSKFNVYKVDVIGLTLTPAVLAGIVNSSIVGLTSASNYLVLHDDVTVYWSSATDPEDFVPSIISGAGSGVPQDVNGMIIGCLPLNNGFAIYTTTNIVIASYSGNTQFPWIFKGAANSAGILNTEQVSYDGDNGTNYAWTSAGLLKVAATGCTPVYPEATDFLSGRIFEDFDDTSNALSTIYMTDAMKIKVSYVASRYLILSYGITSLTHALVFDVALKRWGKLKISHVDCFEVSVNAETAATWTSLLGTTWLTYLNSTWSEFKTIGNITANPGRTLGFLQADGSVQLAIWDYGNFSANAVLLLGKYQLTRTQLCTMQGFDIENVDLANTAFSCLVLSTLDGKTFVSAAIPNNPSNGTLVKRFDCRIAGENHSILFKGAFNLVSTILRMSRQGRR